MIKLHLLECPKEKCWFWISPGGAADMSGQIYNNITVEESIQESLNKGKWKSFPDGGCSCLEKCVRLFSEVSDDWFEPI